MKMIKVLASMAVVFMLCSAFSVKGDNKNGVYMVGVSASFSDSLVYFTDVLFVDSVKLNKDKMLPERGQYSSQLDSYLLQSEGLRNRTSFIYFDTKKERLEKNIGKMKKDYQKGGKSIVKQVNPSFKFTKAIIY